MPSTGLLPAALALDFGADAAFAFGLLAAALADAFGVDLVLAADGVALFEAVLDFAFMVSLSWISCDCLYPSICRR